MSKVEIGKTVYDKALPSDGKRILVMRLWPRGVRKDLIDLWLKEVGTDKDLIKEWKAGKVQWSQFEKCYLNMMKGGEQQELVKQIAGYAKRGKITLLCSCKEPSRCHRSLLKKLVEAQL